MRKGIAILALTMTAINTYAETINFKWKGVIAFKYHSIHNAGFSLHTEKNEKSMTVVIEKVNLSGITVLQYPI
ncbi:hypothetical protein ACT0HV_000569 [Vibrio diabolicus]